MRLFRIFVVFVLALFAGGCVDLTGRSAAQLLPMKPGQATPFTREGHVYCILGWLGIWSRGMDVVAHGPVANDENGYFLVRSFASLAELAAQEDEFYGSAAWREGPREALVARIDTYLDSLLWLSPSAIADLREGNGLPLTGSVE
jgi:hypothetical protein